MIDKKTIMITCVGGGLSCELIARIKSSKIYSYEIIGVDQAANVTAKNLCDIFKVVPSGEDVNYAQSILEI